MLRKLSVLLCCLPFTHVHAQIIISTDSSTRTLMYKAQSYYNGIAGMQEDHAKAFDLYMICAERGLPQAMNMVANIYKSGIGVQQNIDSAVKWYIRTGEAGYANGWYLLGEMYKKAEREKQDFIKAYLYYSKGAALGSDLCEYMQAYMLYKGFGCTQDYAKAATIFRKQALKDKASSMYFLGLCMRNGYGTNADSDSAAFWLKKAEAKGYTIAANELKMQQPENNNEGSNQLAAVLTKEAVGRRSSVNIYKRIENSLDAGEIEGRYSGNIIRYDWSGKNVIGVSPLILDLKVKNGKVIGLWTQDSDNTVPFEAFLTTNALIFKNTTISKKDHYSPDNPMQYNFEKARLQWDKKGDSSFLEGNIEMFSLQKNEPEKPQYVLLKRISTPVKNKVNIQLINEDGAASKQASFSVYPNPFTTSVTVYFNMARAGKVRLKITDAKGNIVYTGKEAFLKGGRYVTQILPEGLSTGSYILSLISAEGTVSAKLIKL